jgi:hypothetical protein
MESCTLCPSAAPMLDNASRVDSTYTYVLLQAREIALTNPTRHALSYMVRLEGDGDSFVLDASVIKIEPGTSVQVCAVCAVGVCCMCCMCQAPVSRCVLYVMARYVVAHS